MADSNKSYEQAITDLVSDIEDRMKPITEDMRLVNRLCERAGMAPRFPEADKDRTVASTSFRRDQFYGKGLATAIREFLTARGPSDRGGRGAATVSEIYDALASGGFKFEAKDELNAKRGLRVALTKNSVTFHRVASGTGDDAYGLIGWYPNARPEKTDDEKAKAKKPGKGKAKRGRPPKKTAPKNVVDLKQSREPDTEPEEKEAADTKEASAA